MVKWYMLSLRAMEVLALQPRFGSDLIQNTNLYNHIYLPNLLENFHLQLHGNEYEVLIRHREEERIFDIKCKNQIFGARQGNCLINTSMDYLPPKNISRYDCEVSGERPRFRTDKKSCAIVPFGKLFFLLF